MATQISRTRDAGYPKIFDLKGVGGRLRGLRLLDRRRTAIAIELVEAAVHRCETIAKELDVTSRSTTMTDLLYREEALGPYLAQYPDEPFLALAIAKGDISHYRALRVAKWSVFSLRPLVKTFLLPVVLILLTALLGQSIGNSLQDRSFRRQRVFDLKRDRLVQGQQRAVDLYNDLERLQSSLSIREGDGMILAADLSDIRAYSGRLEGLRAISEGLVDKQNIDPVLIGAGDELKNYADCLFDKGSQSGEATCSRAFNLTKFKQIIYSFSDALISFMEQPVSTEISGQATP